MCEPCARCRRWSLLVHCNELRCLAEPRQALTREDSYRRPTAQGPRAPCAAMTDFSTDDEGAIVLFVGLATRSDAVAPAVHHDARVERLGDACVAIVTSGLCESVEASGLSQSAAEGLLDAQLAVAGLPPAAMPRPSLRAPLLAYGAAVAKRRTLASPLAAAPASWTVVVLPAIAQWADGVVAFVLDEPLQTIALSTPHAMSAVTEGSVETPRERWSAHVATVLASLPTASGATLGAAISSLREDFGVGFTILRHEVINAVGARRRPRRVAARHAASGSLRGGWRAARRPGGAPSVFLRWCSRAQSLYKPTWYVPRKLRDVGAAAPWPTEAQIVEPSAHEAALAVAQAVAGEVRPLMNYGRFPRVAVRRRIDSVLVAVGMRDARHMHAVIGHLSGASLGPMSRASAIALVERRLRLVSRMTANVGRVAASARPLQGAHDRRKLFLRREACVARENTVSFSRAGEDCVPDAVQRRLPITVLAHGFCTARQGVGSPPCVVARVWAIRACHPSCVRVGSWSADRFRGRDLRGQRAGLGAELLRSAGQPRRPRAASVPTRVEAPWLEPHCGLVRPACGV